MVMHVALEYAVPHLGLTSQLMYGGLGKVVETFICHTTRPMLVCAPMYAPFYAPPAPGAGTGPVLGEPFAGTTPVMSLPAIVGGTKHLVDVYVTAAAPPEPPASPKANGFGGNADPHPTVFFLLLASDIFTRRTRGTIYQHARCVAGRVGPAGRVGSGHAAMVHPVHPWRHPASPPPPTCRPLLRSEAEELAFFSIFNQAVAHVVETLGVGSLQFHDYHGGVGGGGRGGRPWAGGGLVVVAAVACGWGLILGLIPEATLC